jgi:hypothetical protein
MQNLNESPFARTLFGVTAAVALFLGGFGVLETQENEDEIFRQSQKYEQLQSKIETLSRELARNDGEISSLMTLGSPPGRDFAGMSFLNSGQEEPDETKIRSFCLCVPADNSVDGGVRICHSKNSVCDAVSREICEAQIQDYECG